MDAKSIRIVILSRTNVNSLGVIRALGAAGYEIDLVANVYRKGASAVAAGSKYLNKSIEVISKKTEDGKDSVLMEELLKYSDGCVEKTILLPVDDYAVKVVNANRDELSSCFILPSECVEAVVTPNEKIEAEEFSLSGLCLNQEVLIPGMVKDQERAKYNSQVARSGKIVPFEVNAEINEKIINLMKSFHYTGLFELKFQISEDQIFVTRVCFHSGMLTTVYFKCGVNLPDLYIKARLGRNIDVESIQLNEYGKTFVYERAVWKDHHKGVLSKEEMEAYLSTANITLLQDDEDLIPDEIFQKQIQKDYKKNKIKGNRKKKKVHKVTKKVTKLGKLQRKIISMLRKVKYALLGYPQAKAENKRNPESEKPRVLVVGRNYCSNLCMARSMGAAGYEVEILRIFTTKPKWYDLMKIIKPDALSKYVKAYYVCVTNREDDPLVKRLKRLADPNRKMLLVPCDDMSANIVDDHLNELSKYYLLPNVNGKQGEINRMMSKSAQKEMALAAGLPVVNSCMIRASKGVFEIPETVTYPCFIKPNISKNGFKTTMKKCENEEELREALKNISRKKTVEMLVEDFIEIGREYSILGVSTKNGVVGPGFFGAEEGGHEGRRGVALIGKVRPCAERQELIDNILKFIGSLNFEGLFDVDLLETVDGKMYFIELNMRFGGSGYAITKSGVNLPGMYADYMLANKPLDLTCKIEEPGKMFISEKIMIEEYMNSFLTWSGMKERMKRSDIFFIKDEEDPRPYRHFKKFYCIAALMKVLHKVKVKLTKAKRQLKNRTRNLLNKLKCWMLGYPQMKKRNRRNPNAEIPRVLVAGRNYCSNLCMARSVGKAGYEVEILRIFIRKPKLTNLMKHLKPDAYSKYVKAFHICISNRKEERIVEALKQLADPQHKMLLIPVDDLVANAVDAHLDELSEYYLLSNVDGKQDEINRMMNKGIQKEMALSAGLPVVNSAVVKTSNGSFEIPDTVSYPCFMKPNISKNGLKSTMRKCETEEELREAIGALAKKKDVEMLVEDYVEIGREFSILGVSTKDGVIGPGFFGAEIGGHAGRRGVAMTGKIRPCSERQELIDNILNFISTLNFVGLFDVDLIETKDGKMYFIELNLRFGGSGYAVTKSGVNLPAMYADYMLKNKPIDLNAKIEESGKTFVSERIMIEEYQEGFITREEMKKCIMESDIHFVKDDEDKKPYKHFQKFYFVAALMKTRAKWKTKKG